MATGGGPREWLTTVGGRVREVRSHRALSQDQLAEMAGISRPYLSAIERGEQNVGLVNLVRIAHALRVDPSDLVRGLGP